LPNDGSLSHPKIRGQISAGTNLLSAEDWPAALLLLEPLGSVPAREATHYELHYTLGSYWRLGNYPQAIEQLQTVVEQVPNHIDARIRLADSLLRVGREKEAVAEWQRVSNYRSAEQALSEGKTAWQQTTANKAAPSSSKRSVRSLE
jgi:hypothetical protein